jgi:hypothetical protein
VLTPEAPPVLEGDSPAPGEVIAWVSIGAPYDPNAVSCPETLTPTSWQLTFADGTVRSVPNATTGITGQRGYSPSLSTCQGLVFAPQSITPN